MFIVVNLKYVLQIVHADGHGLDARNRHLLQTFAFVDLAHIVDCLLGRLVNFHLHLVQGLIHSVHLFLKFMLQIHFGTYY